MNHQEILHHVDHSFLKQTAVWEQIQNALDEAMACQCAAICVPPVYVKQAADYVNGQLPICTAVGFPNGNTTTAVKVFETQEAIQNGADEIDMVIHIGDIKAGLDQKVQEEIAAVKQACSGHILKVIIETCLLTPEEIVRLCRIVSEGGADYIKTSTGFAAQGATLENVALIKENLPEGLKIKAAGGISSFEEAEEFLKLGADRIGSSRLASLPSKN